MGGKCQKLSKGCTTDTSTAGELRQQDRQRVAAEDNCGIKLALTLTHLLSTLHLHATLPVIQAQKEKSKAAVLKPIHVNKTDFGPTSHL